MKKYIAIIIAILAGLILIFSSCSGPNEAEDLQRAYDRAEKIYNKQVAP